MDRLTRASLVGALATCAACLLCLASVPAASAAGTKAREHVTTESTQAYEQQLAAGEIKAADFRAKRGTLHLTLKDGSHVSVHFVPKQTASLRAALKEHGVSVAVVKAPSHRLRYIAGGVLVVVVIAVIAVLVVWRRRRRAAMDEY